MSTTGASMSRTLARPSAGPLAVLALALALGSAALAAPGAPILSKTELAAIEARRPALVARAEAALLGQRFAHGLDGEAGFAAHDPFTNAQGRTVVRFHQTFRGRRVWAGEGIAHVEPEGAVRTVTAGLKPGVALTTAGPSLGAEQALAIALKRLAPKGPLARPPRVEAIVFPTSFTGGLATRYDPARQAVVFDRELSLWGKPPADPYVWAWEVRTILANHQDGHKEICFIVDGTTGAILRIWNDLQADTAAQGTGKGFYSAADLPLATAQAADGTFSLVSLDKGTKPQPFVAGQGETQVGLTTYYGYWDIKAGQLGFLPYAGHATNTWGNHAIIDFPYDPQLDQVLLDYSQDGTQGYLKGALTAAGETSAADAHYGLGTTWDFYRNVFNRLGPDGKDTSTLAVVHHLRPGGGTPIPFYDNAYWSNGFFGMFFGEGSRQALRPDGMISLTEIDITGHEMSHGVCFNTANLLYAGFSGGLNEANSDIFGKMVQAYAAGGGQGTTVPDFPSADLGHWEIGKHSAPTPLRYMYKPSLDGASADGLYDGLDLMDVHYSSGPLNRMFFFLSAGASSDSTKDTFSPYLPGGMKGIGNDKAARIWFKAMTEHLAQDADYPAAREASILAAKELYGAGSAEEIAVRQAFSAINVGLAPGQAPRPYVTLPVMSPEGSFFDVNAVPKGILKKVQVFPTRTKVKLRATVLNTANQALTYPAPPLWEHSQPAGNVAPDGTWTTPNWGFYLELLYFQVNSAADPSQFARGYALLVSLDSDQDNEVDALDLGATAMAWGYVKGHEMPVPNQAVHTGGGGDWDFEFFNQAFTNAFPVK